MNMKNLLAVVYITVLLISCAMVASTLSGCTTIGTALNSVGNYVCTHQDQVRADAERQLASAYFINDPTKRQVAITSANVLIAAVNSCPSS